MKLQKEKVILVTTIFFFCATFFLIWFSADIDFHFVEYELLIVFLYFLTIIILGIIIVKLVYEEMNSLNIISFIIFLCCISLHFLPINIYKAKYNLYTNQENYNHIINEIVSQKVDEEVEIPYKNLSIDNTAILKSKDPIIVKFPLYLGISINNVHYLVYCESDKEEDIKKFHPYLYEITKLKNKWYYILD